MDRSLARISRNWTQWGRKDPLFAVLSLDAAKGNRWDPDAFFATGRDEIRGVLDHVWSLGVELSFGSALDFGCGVGRLTQALAQDFRTCVGVDIAPSMIEAAEAFNQRGDRCVYVVNDAADLGRFESESFDFVYSNIVLQHMPPELSTGYIAEFVRVLAPGGVAVFSCPTRPGLVPTARAKAIRSAKESARTVANAIGGLGGRMPFPKMEMHCVPRSRVEAVVTGAGGDLVEAQVVPWGAPRWETFRYVVRKP